MFFKTLALAGLLALALSGCVNADSFKMHSGDMSDSDGAAIARTIGGLQ